MKRLTGILSELGQVDPQAGPSPATNPALPAEQTFSPEALSIQYAVIAAGICVLIVWGIIRVARPGKLRLNNTPGRPNRLAVAHVLLLLLGMVGVRLLVSAICLRLFGWPAEGTDDYARVSIIAGICAGTATLVLALVVAHFTFRHGLRRGLGLTARHWVYDSARGVLAFLAVMPICLAIMKIVELIVPDDRLRPTHEVLMFLTRPETGIGWRLLAVGLAGLLAPVVEEVFFRGLLQSALRRELSAWTAILAVSAIFAVNHLQYPHTWPALFALAVAMGYNYERTGRLWASILIHMLFNGLSLTMTLMSLP